MSPTVWGQCKVLNELGVLGGDSMQPLTATDQSHRGIEPEARDLSGTRTPLRCYLAGFFAELAVQRKSVGKRQKKTEAQDIAQTGVVVELQTRVATIGEAPRLVESKGAVPKLGPGGRRGSGVLALPGCQGWMSFAALYHDVPKSEGGPSSRLWVFRHVGRS